MNFGGDEVFLVSREELEQVLKKNDVTEYYIEVDMNGAMALALPSKFIDKTEKIFLEISHLDEDRTVDEIDETGGVFYPLKRIYVDDDEDEATITWFKEKRFIKATYSQKLNSWTNEPGKSGKSVGRPKCVAFYSYKGGVGRSTALAIVARLLAKEGLKVAVIDLDLEAPGLNSLLLTKPKTSPFGVVDYLYHAPWIRENLNEKRFISQYIVREEVSRRNENPGQLIVMSAGGTRIDWENQKFGLLFDQDNVEIGLDKNYFQKLGYIDFDLYARQSKNVFGLLLDDIGRYSKADIILVDARTGFSDISGMLLNNFSDAISVHVQDNKQNREGTRFICEHINRQKLDNTIWSHTKIPKNYESGELKGFLRSCICNKTKRSLETCDLNFVNIGFDSSLEDINSHQLKEYVDGGVSVAYKELAEQIKKVTCLDKRQKISFSNKDRTAIINDFDLLINEKNHQIYIAPRFLNKDIELFVGFPGSGKKTLKGYMLEQYKTEVHIVSFEEFTNMKNSAHRILSHVSFLDWTYQEATQAVCKWVLNSKEFFKWLSVNSRLLGKVTKEELKKMRDIPEYELAEQVAVGILDLLFQQNKSFQGWKSVFELLQYRKGYVLPQDILLGVKLYFEYGIKLFKKDEVSHGNNELKVNARAVFSRMPKSLYRRVWGSIGEQKKLWLINFDQQIYQLVRIYKEIVATKQGKNTREIYSEAEIRSLLLKEFSKSGDEKAFYNSFEKALAMDIFFKENYFSLASNRKESLLLLAPVYELINF